MMLSQRRLYKYTPRLVFARQQGIVLSEAQTISLRTSLVEERDSRRLTLVQGFTPRPSQHTASSDSIAPGVIAPTAAPKPW